MTEEKAKNPRIISQLQLALERGDFEKAFFYLACLGRFVGVAFPLYNLEEANIRLPASIAFKSEHLGTVIDTLSIISEVRNLSTMPEYGICGPFKIFLYDVLIGYNCFLHSADQQDLSKQVRELSESEWEKIPKTFDAKPPEKFKVKFQELPRIRLNYEHFKCFSFKEISHHICRELIIYLRNKKAITVEVAENLELTLAPEEILLALERAAPSLKVSRAGSIKSVLGALRDIGSGEEKAGVGYFDKLSELMSVVEREYEETAEDHGRLKPWKSELQKVYRDISKYLDIASANCKRFADEQKKTSFMVEPIQKSQLPSSCHLSIKEQKQESKFSAGKKDSKIMPAIKKLGDK